MFESICIRAHETGVNSNKIDIGKLGEALIFYQKIHVIANRGILEQLIESCGPELIIELVENEFLSITYLNNALIIITQNANTSNEIHDAGQVSSPKMELQNVAPEIFEKIIGKSGKARRLASRFQKKIKTFEHGGEFKESFLKDISQVDYVKMSVKDFFNYHVPEFSLPDPIIFDLENNGSIIQVNSNINLQDANEIYHKRIPSSHSSITNAYILSHLQDIGSDIFFSSDLASELLVNPLHSKLIGNKIKKNLDVPLNDWSKIDSFQDFVFDDSKAISEAINSGDKNFSDLLGVIHEANKFKHWLKDQNPNVELTKSYFKEVTKNSWVDKLPGKSTRWSLFTGAGLGLDALGAGGLGTLTGIGLSALDTFYLDKIIKGWKPNQFIQELEDFVK